MKKTNTVELQTSIFKGEEKKHGRHYNRANPVGLLYIKHKPAKLTEMVEGNFLLL